MEITDARTAREWLKSWSDKPRIGILNEGISGLRGCISIMRSAPRRYTHVELSNAKEALAELEGALERQAEATTDAG